MKKLILFAFTLITYASPLSAHRFYVTNQSGEEVTATIREYEAGQAQGDVLAGPVTIANDEAHTFNIAGQYEEDVYNITLEWADGTSITHSIGVSEDNDFYIDEDGDINED
ncbi:MAG TPA: hypothetical protein VFF04_05200 [Candidatus Babeliales bacterium]|nr:hypothetical protein [Candidatus Babeliales bacterium]